MVEIGSTIQTALLDVMHAKPFELAGLINAYQRSKYNVAVYTSTE